MVLVRNRGSKPDGCWMGLGPSIQGLARNPKPMHVISWPGCLFEANPRPTSCLRWHLAHVPTSPIRRAFYRPTWVAWPIRLGHTLNPNLDLTLGDGQGYQLRGDLIVFRLACQDDICRTQRFHIEMSSREFINISRATGEKDESQEIRIWSF